MPQQFFQFTTSNATFRPNWLQRVFFTAVLIAVLVVAFVIAVPLLLLSIAVVLLLGAFIWVKRLFARAKAPGGTLDPRRNVRVINRPSDDA